MKNNSKFVEAVAIFATYSLAHSCVPHNEEVDRLTKP